MKNTSFAFCDLNIILIKIINKSKTISKRFLLALLLCVHIAATLTAQTASTIEVPEWALPGSKTHKQVPPPAGFHRPTVNIKKRIGMFKGQSDIGGPLVPGSASYDKKTKQYTIASAGYNIWYFRDEFRYLWKKMSGDVSLAADVNFPDKEGYFDRKAVLIIRQNLEDDAKEAMTALHGGGLIHLAYRPEKGQNLKEMKVDKKGAMRIGIEKKGDYFTVYLSMSGEPMQQYGTPVELHMDGPFYVGIGFCSHQPVTVDKTILSNIVMVNSAGKIE
ncbi:MAG: hypothetical protein WBP00_05110 [Saprospiraceae bacterium]